MCGCHVGRRVSFLEDRAGQPWTWVMGEHPEDKTIEQLLEDEAKDIAREQAELETEELRYSYSALRYISPNAGTHTRVHGPC